MNEIHKNSGSTKNLVAGLELAQNARKMADLEIFGSSRKSGRAIFMSKYKYNHKYL